MPGNDSYTKILLHFEGADGSTTLVDSNRGGSAHTWTANGNAQLDTGVAPAFGTAYGLFDGTGDYWSTPDHADFALGSGDFTIDCWVLTGSGNGTRRLFCGHGTTSAATTSFHIEISAANVIRAGVGNGSTITVVLGTTALTTVGWHHVALVRTGNILKLFVDGVQDVANVAFTGTVFNATTELTVGRAGSFASLYHNGGLDEFRLSVGIARWTSNFTPPLYSYGPDFTADAAAFALTGASAAVKAGRAVAAADASFALTGNDIGFISPSAASFGLSGGAIRVPVQRAMSALPAPFVLGGGSVQLSTGVLPVLVVEPAAFVLNGQAVYLVRGRALQAPLVMDAQSFDALLQSSGIESVLVLDPIRFTRLFN